MRYKGLRVKHKAYGEGVVIKDTSTGIEVKFKSKTTTIGNEFIDKVIEFLDPISTKTTSTARVARKKPTNTRNYAFKCNYCDGGATDTVIGYRCPCSDDVLKWNVELSKDRWCANERCVCKQYHDGLIDREQVEKEKFVCYETNMFKEWGFWAGYNNRSNPPKPRHMPGIIPGGLCLFTTQEKDSKDRIIIGAYIANSVYEGDHDSEGYAKCVNSDLHVELTRDEAYQLKFWDYHKNAGNPESTQWSQGLYRTITTNEGLDILQKIYELKVGTFDEIIVFKMLVQYMEKNNIGPNDPALSEIVRTKVIEEKYGQMRSGFSAPVYGSEVPKGTQIVRNPDGTITLIPPEKGNKLDTE